jgi:hypothetical protein
MLAHRLTCLRRAARPSFGDAVMGFDRAVNRAVRAFIAALPEETPDQAKVATLRQEIEETADADVKEALDEVCAQPAVQTRLQGGNLLCGCEPAERQPSRR